MNEKNIFPKPQFDGTKWSTPTAFWNWWNELVVPTEFRQCIPYEQQVKWLFEKKSPLIVAGDNVGIVEQDDGTLKINVTDTSYGSHYEIIEMTNLPAGIVKGYNLINSDTGEEKGVAILIPDQHYDDTTITNDITEINTEMDKKNPLLVEGSNVTIVDNSDGTQTISVNGITLSVSIASTTTIAAGQNARVENVGTDENMRLAFYIPRGADGQPGTDGYSPSASVTKSGDTATITITDINGTSTAQVSDGQPGADGQPGTDGYSPSASVTKSGDTATITITDANGTTTAQVSDGQPGTDGYSPSASVTKSGDTATITITDANGTTTAQVSDGQPGTDGYSPSASVSKVGHVATITITDANGTTTAQVEDGNGTPGYSPSASVTKSGDTATITITDINGTSTAQVSDGQPGQPGTDGYSPSASVSKVGHVATITITDQNGTTTAQISDGEDGQPGADGQPGTDGYSPSASVTKSGDTATITITDINGTSTAQVSDGTPGIPGTNGNDGITPHIDSTTGNWFIGATDTGVQAQGPQGNPGIQGPAGPTLAQSAEYMECYVCADTDGEGNFYERTITGTDGATLMITNYEQTAIIRHGGNDNYDIDILAPLNMSIDMGASSLTLARNTSKTYSFSHITLVPNTYATGTSFMPIHCKFTKKWYQPVEIGGDVSLFPRQQKYNNWNALITWDVDYSGFEGDTNMGTITITLLAPNSAAQSFPDGFSLYMGNLKMRV